MSSLAEQRAVREGLPIVRALPSELVRVAQGYPIIVGTVDGGEACVRLATAEEFLAVNHAAVDKYGGGQKVSLERARELTRPLPDYRNPS